MDYGGPSVQVKYGALETAPKEREHLSLALPGRNLGALKKEFSSEEEKTEIHAQG